MAKQVARENAGGLSRQALFTQGLPRNIVATSNPGANDDINSGYNVGSIWVNVSTDAIYFCADAADGAAVWALTASDAVTEITELSDADGNFIVGNGSAWVAESGATARTSLGLGTAAVAAARFFPDVVFYSYTKSIHLLQRYLADKGKLPSNFVFTCSKGGLFDHLIPSTNTKSARVFFSNEEAKALGLDIDHTDDFAISGSDDFALVLHGSQPAKSKASKALSELKKKGFTGYSKKKPVVA